MNQIRSRHFGVARVAGPQGMILLPEGRDHRKRIGFWKDPKKSIVNKVKHMKAFAEMRRRGDDWDGGVADYLQKQAALPDPKDFIDPDWNPRERDVVARYLDAGEEVNSYRGWSNCRICGKHNGSTDLGDAKYLWPQGFGHYVRDHSVRPPREFIDHIRRASGKP